ncbi:serine dehydratase beta chain [Limosilactobacillus ingluviei]|uniref:L-serine ammonia-lyase n=1 Tax=Limosilactobacillus ingluviei TaxID=148604 RepID=A0A0R2GT06_9LACO|nr:serine dehydratase beta chain [Limosilactobacillus ingluviei]KRN43872.1 l-serine dehydratase beta subunit [Limosilactobacillus ingluviei]
MGGNYRSVFDIIGPVMIGPSSSHTAGAVALGQAARKLLWQTPHKATVHYYESFALTHRGHGTDYAIAAGLLGLAPADARVPQAPQLARQAGLDLRFVEESGPSPIHHPNTAVIELWAGQQHFQISGCSIGGGTIEIRAVTMHGISVQLAGALPLALYYAPDHAQLRARQLVQHLRQLVPIKRRQIKRGQAGAVYVLNLGQALATPQVEQLMHQYPDLTFL